MAHDIKVQAGVGNNTVAPPVVTDEIGGRHYQKIKLVFGADGSATDVREALTARFPVESVYEAIYSMTVAIGQTISTVVDLGAYHSRGLIVGPQFDGTTITFQVAATEGGTYVPLYDITNTQISMAVAASRAYDLPGELMVWRFVKIVCDTTQTTTTTDFTWVVQS